MNTAGNTIRLDVTVTTTRVEVLRLTPSDVMDMLKEQLNRPDAVVDFECKTNGDNYAWLDEITLTTTEVKRIQE